MNTTGFKIVAKNGKFVVSLVDANGYHIRYMFGVKFNTTAEAQAAIDADIAAGPRT